MQELKKCPLCNSDASVFTNKYGQEVVTCSENLRECPISLVQFAVLSWQIRPIEDALQTKLDQLRADNQALVEQMNENAKTMQRFLEVQKAAFLRLLEWNPGIAQDFVVLLTLDIEKGNSHEKPDSKSN